jgi:hypothetical protein
MVSTSKSLNLSLFQFFLAGALIGFLHSRIFPKYSSKKSSSWKIPLLSLSLKNIV